MMKHLLPLSRQCEEVYTVITINDQAGASWYRFLNNLRTLVAWCQPTLLASVRWAGRESLTHLADDVGAQSVAD